MFRLKFYISNREMSLGKRMDKEGHGHIDTYLNMYLINNCHQILPI
jgi:hypothetical protein